MSSVKELLDEAIYAGNLSEKEEKELYSWIELLILAKRKADEYEAKAAAFDRVKIIHLNLFGDKMRSITGEEAETFGINVMRVLSGKGNESGDYHV